MRTLHTTVDIKVSIKTKLDKNRAPGQCYDGFICQLIDLWEQAKEGRKSYVAGYAGGNHGAWSGIAKQLK